MTAARPPGHPCRRSLSDLSAKPRAPPVAPEMVLAQHNVHQKCTKAWVSHSPAEAPTRRLHLRPGAGSCPSVGLPAVMSDALSRLRVRRALDLPCPPSAPAGCVLDWDYQTERRKSASCMNPRELQAEAIECGTQSRLQAKPRPAPSGSTERLATKGSPSRKAPLEGPLDRTIDQYALMELHGQLHHKA